MVSDLFGQVPKGDTDTVSFAGRVRPHNLVFYNGAEHLINDVTLAPLSSPKPGCMAFYRKGGADSISSDSPMRGYKIYRNTDERGEKPPWSFDSQGVYDKGALKNRFQKVNKTVDLLDQEQTGHLMISFRALSKKELALLMAASTVDWKLGGGKPLGLGHCRPVACRVRLEKGDIHYNLISENDQNIILPDDLDCHLLPDVKKRIHAYMESQKPVNGKLRYPRVRDKNKNQGGHIWFSRFAMSKQNGNGMESIKVDEQLKMRLQKAGYEKNDAITSQPLPERYDQPLFGYDSFVDLEKKG